MQLFHKPGHIRVAKVHIHKRHIVRFGLVFGALFMAADMAFALGIGHMLGDHLAHVFGATGATMSGGAAAVDALVEDVII